MTKPKRVAISKKLRFEVFKRDCFSCKYCGAKAPDVVLEVDHINPVCEGGTNDILNLVTSCFDCNRGKGKRKLSDDTEVKKQYGELEKLQIEKDQLTMLLEWREELKGLSDEKLDYLVKLFEDGLGVEIRDSGIKTLRRLMGKFEYSVMVESIDIAIENYDDGNIAFSKIGGIARNLTVGGDQSCKYRFGYAKGILKNRLSYFNERALYTLFSKFKDDIDSIERFIDVCKDVKNWTELKEILELSIGYKNDMDKGAPIDSLSECIRIASEEVL